MYVQSNEVIMSVLDEYVTGHLEAKKALCVLARRIYIRSCQKYVKQMSDEFLISPLKLLLLGSSGTGKSYLVKVLTDNIMLPFIKLDATDLNPTGASGGHTSNQVAKMIKGQAEDIYMMFPHTYTSVQHVIDCTIVYIDEIDKLGTSFESSGNWNKHVQSNFLTLFDDKDTFGGVSFIFSGAFDSITREKKKANTFGFTEHKELNSEREVLDEQIIAAGIIPELLGRINTVVKLDNFTKDDFVRIIKERIFPKKQMDLAAYGIFDVKLSDSDLEEVAQKAVKSGQGVRYAQREIDRLFLDVEFEAEESILMLKHSL